MDGIKKELITKSSIPEDTEDLLGSGGRAADDADDVQLRYQRIQDEGGSSQR